MRRHRTIVLFGLSLAVAVCLLGQGTALAEMLDDDFSTGYTTGDIIGQTGGAGWDAGLSWARAGNAEITAVRTDGEALLMGKDLAEGKQTVYFRTYADPGPAPYTLSFTIKVLDMTGLSNTTIEDYFQVFDRSGTNNDFGGSGRWVIRGNAAVWDGAAYVAGGETETFRWKFPGFVGGVANAWGDRVEHDSGIELVEDHTYQFEVRILGGGQWQGTVTDLDTAGSYTSPVVGFRAADAMPSRQINLGMKDNGSPFGSIWMEVDNLQIPEPATMILLGFGGAAVLARRRRRS